MLLAAVLALASLQSAPPPPAGSAEPDSAEVVVTAAPDQEAQIRAFVDSLAATPSNGQLSRFEDAACPAVFGLPDDKRKAVAERIRRIAASIDVAVGRAGCTPNILVMVTADKRAMLNALRRDPSYFWQVSSPDMRRLHRDPGPTAAWYGKRTRNADGHDLGANADYQVNRTTRPASRLTPGGRPMTVAAALIVERRALDGLTTTQLADYAAMRTLGQADPARLPANPPATILTALEAPMGAAIPLTLTAWDLGFLRGFYAGNANLYAPTRRAEIKRTMAREVSRSAPPGK